MATNKYINFQKKLILFKTIYGNFVEGNGNFIRYLKEWYYHPDWDSLSNVQIDDINLSECGFDINRHPAGDSTYFNKTSRYGYGPIASQICDENKNW